MIVHLVFYRDACQIFFSIFTVVSFFLSLHIFVCFCFSFSLSLSACQRNPESSNTQLRRRTWTGLQHLAFWVFYCKFPQEMFRLSSRHSPQTAEESYVTVLVWIKQNVIFLNLPWQNVQAEHKPAPLTSDLLPTPQCSEMHTQETLKTWRWTQADTLRPTWCSTLYGGQPPLDTRLRITSHTWLVTATLLPPVFLMWSLVNLNCIFLQGIERRKKKCRGLENGYGRKGGDMRMKKDKNEGSERERAGGGRKSVWQMRSVD